MISNKNFPDKYESLETAFLINVFSQGPGRLLKVVENLKLEEMKMKVIPDKWTILEIIMHVVDSELMGYCRINQTITQSSREFAFYNQNIWTEVLNYNTYPPDVIDNRLRLFNHLRNSQIYTFKNLSINDWLKKGKHPEMGDITIRNLLELYTDHCERHIDQILQRRKILGKPIDLEKMLELRLY
jgi:DinB superfamily